MTIQNYQLGTNKQNFTINIIMKKTNNMKPIQTLETMSGLSLQNILTRAVRRLNQSKRSGLIKDYTIHNLAGHYFYEIID